MKKKFIIVLRVTESCFDYVLSEKAIVFIYNTWEEYAEKITEYFYSYSFILILLLLFILFI